MKDFIISVPINIERENLRHNSGNENDFVIPSESFLENESPNYDDFLFSYDFVVNEMWKDKPELENHRLLTVDEWDSIFSIRPQKYFHVEVNNINGVILMPDNASYKDHLSQSYTKIGIEEWYELEKIGAIFLPGANLNDNIISPYALNSKIEGRQIGHSHASLVAPINKDDKFFVRLVKKISNR